MERFKKLMKLTMWCGLVLASQPTLAAGFYTGLGVGVSSLKDRISTSNDLVVRSFGNDGVIGSALLGYEFPYAGGPIGLGLEVFANEATTSATANNEATHAEFKIASRFVYGARVLPNYKITPDVLTYLVLGYAHGTFQLTDDGVYGNASSTFGDTGFQVGLGAAASVIKQVAIRGDIIYTAYGDHAVNGTTALNAPMNYRNQLNTVDALISVIYKFN